MPQCHYCLAKFPSAVALYVHARDICIEREMGGAIRCHHCFILFMDIHTWRRHILKKHPTEMLPSPCTSKSSPAQSPQLFGGVRSPALQRTPSKRPSEDAEETVSAKRRLFVPSTPDHPVDPVGPGGPSTALAIPDVQAQQIETARSMCNAEYLSLVFARIFSSVHTNTGVTGSLAQHFAECIEELLVDGIDSVMDMLLIKHAGPDGSVCDHFLAAATEFKKLFSSSFSSFRTTHLREKYFRKLGTYIQPCSISLGPQMVAIGRNPPCVVTSTAQMICIDKVLQRLLSIPGLMAEMDEHIQYCDDDDGLLNIVHSEGWFNTTMSIKSDMEGKLYPLLLYFDEFETGNPLGSHSGIHKLGALYVSLPCLPTRLVSQLSYIFLLYLFHASDRVSFGNLTTFQPVIARLNKLATEGVTVTVGGEQVNVRFAVAAIVGDNLGLHSVLGFSEGFTANFPCRLCRASKKQCGEMLVEDPSLLRDRFNYSTDLAVNDVKQTGVKEQCVWSNLAGFDLFENVGVDIMHDLYEGVAKYVMTVVVNKLLKEKAFSLDYLNDRMVAFDYGPDSDNKPPPLSWSDKSVKIRMSSAECHRFIMYFGCFIGHRIQRFDLDDDYMSLSLIQRSYLLYILLLRVEELVMSTCVTRGLSINLQERIEEMNALYMHVGETKLQPKFHHLVHYPNVLLRLGPVSHLWSMRFEGKHRAGKKAAAATANRINLCKTTAKKIQLQVNELFVRNTLRPPLYLPSRGVPCHSSIVNYLNDHCGNVLPSYARLSSHSHIVSPSNITYRRRDILLRRICEDSMYPVFVEIDAIYYEAVTAKCYIQYRKLDTLYFDYHFFGYAVAPTSEKGIFDLKEMQNHIFPNTLVLPTNERKELIVICRNRIL